MHKGNSGFGVCLMRLQQPHGEQAWESHVTAAFSCTCMEIKCA